MKQSQESIHLTGRGKAVAVAVAGLALLGLGLKATHTVGHIQENLHNRELSDKYDEPRLARNLESHNIDPASVTLHTIKGGETPESIAVDMGATEQSMPWVVKEIAGQAGGEYRLQPNDVVVVPNEQLSPKENS